jgi:hypothetical protein
VTGGGAGSVRAVACGDGLASVGAMTSTIELGLGVGGLASTAVEEIGGDSELDGGW